MVSLPNCRVLPTLNCRISNSNLTSNLKFELQALAAPAALFYLGKLCSAPLPLRSFPSKIFSAPLPLRSYSLKKLSAPLPLRSFALKKLSAPIPLRSFRLPKFSAPLPLPLLHAFGGLRSAPAFFRSKSLIYAQK
jgi:hypothetical protein